MTTRRRAGVALLGALGLVMTSACGGSGSANGARRPTTTTTAAASGGPRGHDKTKNGLKKKGSGATAPCPALVGEASPEDTRIAFEDGTAKSGLIDPLLGMYGHAVATADVNGDGFLDLYVGTFNDKTPDKYQQRGATGPAPDRVLFGGEKGFTVGPDLPEARGRTSGAVFVDLNDDGHLDLVVSRNVGGRDSAGPAGSDGVTEVLANDGKGHFRVAAHIAPGIVGRGIGVLDYDADGKPDLFVTGQGPSGPSVLLHNMGGFDFQDATEAAGLPADVGGLAVAAADLTGDGRPDLFLPDAGRLFVNAGEGKFREAPGNVFAWERYGNEDLVAGVAVGDLNRDGRPDLVVGHHFGSTVAPRDCAVPVRVYLNRGLDEARNPRFEDVTVAAGLVSMPTKTPHVEIADMDDDGWPDIVTSASSSDGTAPAVLRNLGVRDGLPHFGHPAGLGRDQYWVTGATADFDGDGHLDLFLAEFEPSKPSKMFINRSSHFGHWVEIGARGPGLAPGTIVEVYRSGRAGQAADLLERAEVIPGIGYAAGGPPLVHVGLGSETRVDVVVRPPRGSAHTLRDQAVDRRLTISS